MPHRLSNGTLRHLRRLVVHQERRSDSQLLACFLQQWDESAFEELVRRHGPMVLSVCRRVLRDSHDADDAFQATFVVLLRKAATLRRRELLANWLYGVAYRTALEAKVGAYRRRRKEKEAAAMPKPNASADDAWLDLQPLLDHELNRLPDKYRIPIVLCELEGRSRKEAARMLGIAEGTLSSRLARARQRLTTRLGRHAPLATGAVTALLAGQAASASVPPTLLTATLQTATMAVGRASTAGAVSLKAAALAERVLKTMFLTKLKVAAALVLFIAALGVGAAALPDPSQAGEQVSPAKAPALKGSAPAATEPGTLRQALQKEHWLLGQVNSLKNTIDVSLDTAAPYTSSLTRHDPWMVWAGGTSLTLEGLPVDFSADIRIDGKKCKLTELRPGMRLSLHLAAETDAVTKIDARTPKAEMVLKAVDPVRNTITIQARTTFAVADLPVPKGATILLDAKNAVLGDLKPGMQVRLTLGPDEGRLAVRRLDAARVGP
jgi:RNA polymerase sigma factor (sigma-70 family)